MYPRLTAQLGSDFVELPAQATWYTIPANTLRVGVNYEFAGIGTQGIGNSGLSGMPIPNTAAGFGWTIGAGVEQVWNVAP